LILFVTEDNFIYLRLPQFSSWNYPVLRKTSKKNIGISVDHIYQDH